MTDDFDDFKSNCPILSAGWLATGNTDVQTRIKCDEEKCGLWDGDRRCCGLKAETEDDRYYTRHH